MYRKRKATNGQRATMIFCVVSAIVIILAAVLSACIDRSQSGSKGSGTSGEISTVTPGKNSGTDGTDGETSDGTDTAASDSSTDSTTSPNSDAETSAPESTAPPETTAPPEPVRITVAESSVELTAGGVKNVSFTLSPKGSDPDSLTVHVDNASVASAVIANTGAEETGEFDLTITAAAEGKAKVEIKYDGEVAASIDVTVKDDGTTPLPPVTQTSDIDPTKPMIALTFDDGPGNYTDELLDILKKYNVHCTFFVTGNRLKKYDKSLLERMVSDGNEIGIHTWDHTKLTTLSKSEIKEEILSVRDTLQELIGYTPRLMRPPYGSTNDDVVDVCRSEGFIIVRWCLDTEDWKTRDPDKTHEAIMNNVKDGVIILCHDIHEETVAGMDRTISTLVEKGYQLVTVSEMLQYSKTVPVAGDIVKRK